MGVEDDRHTPTTARLGLGRREQRTPDALAAARFVDPEVFDARVAAPREAVDARDERPALVAQEAGQRLAVAVAGRREVELEDRVA